MATASNTQIPSARVPLSDDSGYVAREWYLFWYNQTLLNADLQAQITALEARVAALEPP